jgi:hypothetical protein
MIFFAAGSQTIVSTGWSNLHSAAPHLPVADADDRRHLPVESSSLLRP